MRVANARLPDCRAGVRVPAACRNIVGGMPNETFGSKVNQVKILMLTWGSMGDLMPFVALARELANGGHRIVLGGPNLFALPARDFGLEFKTVGSHLTREAYDALMDRVRAEINPRKQLKILQQEVLVADLETQFEDVLHLIGDIDLVVCHWMQLAGMMAAEKAGVPCVTLTLNPVGVGCLFQSTALEGARSSQRNIARELADLLWGDGVQRFRTTCGLPPIQSVAEYQYSSGLNLVAVSRHLLPDCDRWPSEHRVVGFFNGPAAADWRPDERLAAFFDGGEKPIVVSFGSMSGTDARQTTRLVVDAVEQLGSRAIVQAGWAGLGDESTPPNILRVGYVPHDWLFQRASCVVHHGGAGTTAAALRAGVPSVIVWHMLDQSYWGAVLSTLGVGPKSIARSDMDSATLASLICSAIGNSAYGEACSKMGELIRSELGTRLAAWL